MKNIRSILKAIVALFVLSTVGCNKVENKINSPKSYQIDSVVYKQFDTLSNTLLFTYTYVPSKINVFEDVFKRNDTTTYLSKDFYLSHFNSNSIVETKGNRIFHTMYLEPIGEYGQDGNYQHHYLYFNTNNMIDSVVHLRIGVFSIIDPTLLLDTTTETYLYEYVNDNLTSISLNGASLLNFNYSSYLNQKDLIGLDVNEFLGYFNFIHTNFTDYILNGFMDDIGEYQKNCLIHNFNSGNSNSKYLVSEPSLEYYFDVAKNNRIKEISNPINNKKSQQFLFYYKD